MESDRPIVVVACPRSGTTLLQLMLHAHPRIAIPPENRFLLDVYRHRAAYGDLRQGPNRARLAADITGHPTFADFKIDAAATRQAIEEGPPTVGSALGIAFRSYAAHHAKPRWGDKRPMYLNHLPTILRLFPDVQLVHIVRDGRDCVASLKRMPWWTTGSPGAISRWLQSMEIATWARDKLRGDQYVELQYERLVADPEPELRRLCRFLGEEFSESMLEPHRVAPDAVPERKVWHARTEESVSPASVNQWASQLEPWEIGVVELLGGRHLRRYGYALSDPSPRPPAARVAEVARHLARRRWSRRRRAVGDWFRSRRHGHPVAAQLTSGQLRLARSSGALAWTGGDVSHRLRPR